MCFEAIWRKVLVFLRKKGFLAVIPLLLFALSYCQGEEKNRVTEEAPPASSTISHWDGVSDFNQSPFKLKEVP